MGVSFEYMEDYVIKAYPGERWRLRVQQMPTNQVAAIYHNLINRKPKNKKKDTNVLLVKPDPFANGVQMTIFDFINEKGELI